MPIGVKTPRRFTEKGRKRTKLLTAPTTESCQKPDLGELRVGGRPVGCVERTRLTLRLRSKSSSDPCASGELSWKGSSGYVIGSARLRRTSSPQPFRGMNHARSSPAMRTSMVRTREDVIGLNIDRLQSRVMTESDPDRRHFYFRLMAAEEDKFGSIEEKIDIAESKIASVKNFVEKQKYILAQIEKSGRDSRLANEILDALIQAQILLERRLNDLLRVHSGPINGAD